jgi:4,4'-diaponeurosporenoate glycosyltransferase
MSDFFLVFCLTIPSAVIFLYRMWPKAQVCNESSVGWLAGRVTIIIPARNEEENLKILLPSLNSIDDDDFEVMVVNDHSTDNTVGVCQDFGVRVVDAPPKPDDWLGKTWACHYGAGLSSSPILLFTDADTEHLRGSLKNMRSFMGAHHLDLCSAIPFHKAPSVWEKMLGPFHMILLMATAPFQKPKSKRVFAIGQYLMFRAEAYRSIHGHTNVRGQIAEDLGLASCCIDAKLLYGVYPSAVIFHVRMYQTLLEHIAGWRRNFRVGMKRSSLVVGVETSIVFASLLSMTKPGAWPSIALILVFMACTQRRYGEFSIFGVLFYPFSLFVFCLISLLAVVDSVRKAPFQWKGRVFR